MVALRKEFLRQHYLDQVLGSFAFRAKLSAFVVPWTAGWLPIADQASLIGDCVKLPGGDSKMQKVFRHVEEDDDAGHVTQCRHKRGGTYRRIKSDET